MVDLGRPLLGQHALVTGAGSGIGLAIAKRLAAMGASVTLVGRTIERLQTAATEIGRTSDCDIVQADVGDAGAVRRAFDTVDKRGRVLRMLINNAGSAKSAKFTETDWPVWE